MMMVKGDRDYERGVPPSPALLAAIGALGQEMAQAGKLVQQGGLAPSAMGALLDLENGEVRVTDGPFSESKEVIGGYAILQPRITASLPRRTERSAFQKLYAGAMGTDPYVGAVSDVYQDLFGRAIYTGKGLYDVEAFEASLHGRVPDNCVLSHDLFESAYARCALVSDVEFFDEFPSHLEVAAERQHRWTRGDWQLLPWVVGAPGRDLPAVSRSRLHSCFTR